MALPTIDPALYAYPDVDRAWVRVNFVSSVDGSAQGADGVSGMLGTDAD
ncbi:MAG: pyrimidine reductase family protein, partial [Actinomycetales bacterium]